MEKQSLREMASARKLVLIICGNYEETINEHLLKIKTLSMGKLDYSILKDNWRWEISNRFLTIQRKKANNKYLSWEDYYTALFVIPFTHSERFDENAQPDLEMIESLVQNIIDNADYGGTKSDKVPLHFEMPDLQETYDQLDVVHQRISHAMEKGELLDRRKAMEILKESGF